MTATDALEGNTSSHERGKSMKLEIKNLWASIDGQMILKGVNLTVNAAEGPRVRVVFSGDPIPENRHADLTVLEHGRVQ